MDVLFDNIFVDLSCFLVVNYQPLIIGLGFYPFFCHEYFVLVAIY